MAYDQTNFTSKPQVDEVGQIILKARELLSDPDRWCKGKLQVGGRRCIIGALRTSIGQTNDPKEPNYPQVKVAVARLMRELPSGALTIPSFNDARTTAHADVLALLDRTAQSGASK